MYKGDINISSTFTVDSPRPLDDRKIQSTIAERDAIIEDRRYNLMRVDVLDSGSGQRAEYQLVLNTVDNNKMNPENWVKIVNPTNEHDNLDNVNEAGEGVALGHITAGEQSIEGDKQFLGITTLQSLVLGEIEIKEPSTTIETPTYVLTLNNNTGTVEKTVIPDNSSNIWKEGITKNSVYYNKGPVGIGTDNTEATLHIVDTDTANIKLDGLLNELDFDRNGVSQFSIILESETSTYNEAENTLFIRNKTTNKNIIGVTPENKVKFIEDLTVSTDDELYVLTLSIDNTVQKRLIQESTTSTGPWSENVDGSIYYENGYIGLFTENPIFPFTIEGIVGITTTPTLSTETNPLNLVLDSQTGELKITPTAATETTNYITPSVVTGILNIDFNNYKIAVASAAQVLGTPITVDENIEITLTSSDNAEQDFIFIEVTVDNTIITLPANTIYNSGDTRWDEENTRLILNIGTYIIKRNYEGTNAFLTLLPEIYATPNTILNTLTGATENNVFSSSFIESIIEENAENHVVSAVFDSGLRVLTLNKNDNTDISVTIPTITSPLIPQGNWDVSTNTPDISLTTITGQFWIVSIAGTYDLGGITSWGLNDWAVKTDSGWSKVDNQQLQETWATITEKPFNTLDSTYFTVTGDALQLNQIIVNTIDTLEIKSHEHANKIDLDTITNGGSGRVITDLERAKLNAIEEGAEVNAETTDNIIQGVTNLYNIIPAGGTAGQVFTKSNAEDYIGEWSDLPDSAANTLLSLSDVFATSHLDKNGHILMCNGTNGVDYNILPVQLPEFTTTEETALTTLTAGQVWFNSTLSKFRAYINGTIQTDVLLTEFSQSLYGTKTFLDGIVTEDLHITNTPNSNTINSALLVWNSTSKEIELQDNSYKALTAGSTVTFNLTTGTNKTLNVAIDSEIVFSNISSGMSGNIKLNVTVISDITFDGTTITFKGKGTFTDLAVGIHMISFEVISSTEILVNIGSTYDTL